MISRWFNIKSDFSKNVILLLQGTILAQLIPIVISPILARVYTPEDFGIYSLFIGIITVLAGVANGRYDQAIVLPHSEKQSLSLFFLGGIISLLFSFFLLIIIILFNDEIINLLNISEQGHWIFFIPLSVFLVSFFSLLNFINTRWKNFNEIRNITIFKSIILAFSQVIGGWLSLGFNGLILGQVFSQMISNWKLFLNVTKKCSRQVLSLNSMWDVCKRYKNFPLYSSWASLLNSASLHIPVLLLGTLYGMAIAGFFSLAFRVVGLPVSIIGNSLGQVFFQKANSIKNDAKELKNFVYVTYIRLVKISAVPLFLVLSFGSDVFTMFFGENWSKAGEYVQLLSFWLLFVFITSPISNLLTIFEKQKENLILNVVLFFSRILSIYIGYIIWDDPAITILLYGIVGTVVWMGLCAYILKLAHINLWEFIKPIILYVGSSAILGIILNRMFN